MALSKVLMSLRSKFHKSVSITSEQLPLPKGQLLPRLKNLMNERNMISFIKVINESIILSILYQSI